MPKITFLIIVVVFLILNCNAQTTIVYPKDSTSILQNPERGFCEYSITFASNYSYLTTSFLDNIRSTKNQTILFRYFNLDTFLNAPITATFLSNIQSDFDTLRKAGFKVIVRFAYSNVYTPTPPFLDAPPKSLLLTHIAQLKPYLLANADVILTLQNGFWGTWGENYYTDYYGYDGNNSTTASNWADRKEILDSLLTCLPPSLKLSVRTPVKKAYYFNQIIPQDSLTVSTSNNSANIARVGGHNDCFLADYNDYTFDDTTIEKPFWSAESKYTIMGGETCNDNPIFTNCTNAKSELQRFHWTYCNDLYEPNVIDRWKNNNCFAEIENKLGYRIRLVQATLSNVSSIGGLFDYTIQFMNDGYAAPANPRMIKIIAKHINNLDSFEMIIPTDIRNWFGKSALQLSGSINLPNNLQIGDYNLYLQLQDTANAIATDARYQIRLANTGIWNAGLGANDLLHTLTLISAPLAIQNFSSQISCTASQNVLSWHFTNPKDIQYYTIETSIDNKNFILFKSISGNVAKQNWEISLAKESQNLYYKITAFLFSGNIISSHTVHCNGTNDWNVFYDYQSKQISIEQIKNIPCTIDIFNTNGILVYHKITPELFTKIHTYNFAKGIYILKMNNAENSIVKKIMIP